MSSRDSDDNGSITEDVTESELSDSFDKLLGDDDVPVRDDSPSLLRIKDGILSADLAEKLGVKAYKPNVPAEFDLPPVVVGPYPLETLRELASARTISSSDGIMKLGDRWRTVRALFPELQSAFTVTDELTATAGGAGFEDSSGTRTDETPALGSEESKRETTTVQALPKLVVEDIAQPQRSGPAPVRKAPSPQPQVTRRVSESSSPSMGLKFSLALAVIAVAAGVFFLFKNSKLYKQAGKTILAESSQSPPLDLEKTWPEKLRPLQPQALHASDPPLVQKIRPILTAYERGAAVLSPADEELLKAVSDPASASWEARVLASNQLAVYYLSTQRTADAKRLLDPIYQASPTDPTTLLNLSLISLVEGDLKNAREVGSVGLRLCPAGLQWVAYSILGMIESASGRIEEADKAFENAITRSANNPFIYGMWIQSLFRADPQGKGRIPRLIRNALWADPDRLIDSPIPAPLGGHILVVEALDGFKKGAEWPESKLKAGQIAFFRWLEGRSRFNPLAQSLPQVIQALSTETDRQSQLLYAYGLKEQGHLEQSAEVLDKLIPQLSAEKIPEKSTEKVGEGKEVGSWPWSFAGDVQSALGHPDVAITLYQTALNRNSQDIDAVSGLALALRQKGDFPAAEQKLTEALSLDPFFVPALLRMSRFDWQRRDTLN